MSCIVVITYYSDFANIVRSHENVLEKVVFNNQMIRFVNVHNSTILALLLSFSFCVMID